jgi:hypothetical protein
MTTINTAVIRDLRPVIQKAINEALNRAGLEAHLGRVTYIPGQEFRCKLTVTPTPTKTTKIPSRPAVGEAWRYGGKVYIVEADNGTYMQVSRPSRSRSAHYVPGRGLVANYRVKATDLQLNGAKL